MTFSEKLKSKALVRVRSDNVQIQMSVMNELCVERISTSFSINCALMLWSRVSGLVVPWDLYNFRAVSSPSPIPVKMRIFEIQLTMEIFIRSQLRCITERCKYITEMSDKFPKITIHYSLLNCLPGAKTKSSSQTTDSSQAPGGERRSKKIVFSLSSLVYFVSCIAPFHAKCSTKALPQRFEHESPFRLVIMFV